MNDNDQSTASETDQELTLTRALITSLRLNAELMLIEAGALLKARETMRTAVEERKEQLHPAGLFHWNSVPARYQSAATTLQDSVDDQMELIRTLLSQNRDELTEAGIDVDAELDSIPTVSDVEN